MSLLVHALEKLYHCSGDDQHGGTAQTFTFAETVSIGFIHGHRIIADTVQSPLSEILAQASEIGRTELKASVAESFE